MLTSPYIPTVQLVHRLPKFTLPDSIFLNESQPLTFYYHALLGYAYTLSRLCKKPQSTSRTSEFNTSLKLVLDTLYLIYSEMDDDLKCSREYLRNLQPFAVREMKKTFSIITWQYCIASVFDFLIDTGFAPLKEKAVRLYAAFEATRIKLSIRIVNNQMYPYNDLYPVLVDFDKAWTEFEEELVEICTRNQTFSPDEDLGMLQMVSECLANGALTKELVDERDPIVFVAVPRLVIVGSLLKFNSLLDISDSQETLSWYKPHVADLSILQKALNQFSKEELDQLIQFLVNGREVEGAPVHVLECYFGICTIGDSVASTNAANFNGILSRTLNSINE